MISISQHAHESPGKAALFDGERRVTYSEFYSEVLDRAYALSSSRRSKFYIYAGNEISTISYIYAAALAGKDILCVPDFVPKPLKKLVTLGAGVKKDIKRVRGRGGNLTGGGRMMVFTSGTTGRPKVIAQNRELLIRNWAEIIKPIGVLPEDNVFTTAPTTAAPTTYIVLLSMGCTVNFLKSTKFGGQDVLSGYLSSGSDTLFVTPSVLEKIIDSVGLESFSGLKRVVCASMPFTDRLAERLREYSNIDFVDIYVSSETGIVGYRRPHESKAFTLFDMVVADICGSDIIMSEPTIYTAEAQVVRGKEKDIQFPLYVGDTGRMDGQSIVLDGRSSNKVKVSGFSVSLDVIKEFSRRHGVMPIHIQASGDKIKMLVPDGTNITELRDSLSKSLPWYYIPKEIAHVS